MMREQSPGHPSPAGMHRTPACSRLGPGSLLLEMMQEKGRPRALRPQPQGQYQVLDIPERKDSRMSHRKVTVKQKQLYCKAKVHP